MMTPGQIEYVREWAKNGNAWVPLHKCGNVPMCALSERWGGIDGNEYCLNSAGLTIAALAEFAEQACETAEYRERVLEYERGTCNSADITTMRENRKRLLDSR